MRGYIANRLPVVAQECVQWPPFHPAPGKQTHICVCLFAKVLSMGNSTFGMLGQTGKARGRSVPCQAYPSMVATRAYCKFTDEVRINEKDINRRDRQQSL
jgi:hypothetical protein